MIDLRHPLAVLASRMSWQQIEASVAHLFLRKARADVAMPDLDLFGEQVQRAAVPQARLQRIQRRRGRADSPRWQFFSGCAYYEDRQPCDATTVVKFRQLLGEEGGEELLSQTINVAVDLQLNEQLEQAAGQRGLASDGIRRSGLSGQVQADQRATEKAAQAAPGH